MLDNQLSIRKFVAQSTLLLIVECEDTNYPALRSSPISLETCQYRSNASIDQGESLDYKCQTCCPHILRKDESSLAGAAMKPRYYVYSSNRQTSSVTQR